MTELIPATEGTIEPERISPEGVEVANSYLLTNSLVTTARDLGLTTDLVADQLNDPFVRRYIDTVFLDTGYRNKAKLASVMDSIIDAKLEEMEEAEISSSKDIAELIQLQHKMRMDEMNLQLKMLEAQAKLKQREEARNIVHTGPTVNIQDNSLGGSNYGQLLQQLMGLTNEDSKT